ncbi:MAG: hypothetical protein ABSF45_09715 [Terriglobia bacterium]|jgi:subtilisin family serine protease
MKSLRTLSSAGFLVLALLAASFNTWTASGQDSKGRLSNWDNLKSLTPGQEIRVQMNSDKSYQGGFESLSNDGITLRQPAGEQTLARKDISRISQMNGQNHRARNVLIGTVIGAGLGLAAGLETDHVIWSHVAPPTNPHWALIGTPVVAGTGALIGAVIPTGRSRDIYRSPGWHHLIYRAH